MNKPNKGLEGGACNRTACQSEGFTFCYNPHTYAWYCKSCAMAINDALIATGLNPIVIPENYGELCDQWLTNNAKRV